MPKSRKPIPKATKEKVLKEFNHRCAMCGEDRPQLHHIDENPSNNDIINLIPLCPNCHLIDQHDPTKPLNPKKLSLFRQYKDPHILKPQFNPIFKRFLFLYEISHESDAFEVAEYSEELVDIISELEMGTFYAKKIKSLTKMSRTATIQVMGDPSSRRYCDEIREKDKRNHLSKIEDVKHQVIGLIIEALRYQKWT